MHSASLPLYTPTSSILTTNRNRNRNPKPKAFSFYPATVQKSYGNSFICKASTSSSSITDFDLYDLLGIDSSSDRSQIKMAYRTLQKRCHPDIAGQAGHDMAIILNEAYAVLSNPNSRLAYDKEQGKVAELRGYTGKPIYSAWFGSENEERAVFVDEVKCVGCLKCALFAEKTFAIESVYGRARVVAQWADPEHKIQEAIEACPVDCISMVERSNLAALEFLMSKQPRGNVRVGAGNTGGIRVSNIFVDVDKFQARFIDAMDKATQHSKESDPQREARMSAIQAIRSISNWLYWQSPSSEGRPSSRSRSLQNLPCSAKKSTEPNIKKLRDAAAAIKQARENPKTISSNYIYDDDEYWIQSTLTLPEATPHYHAAGSTTTTTTTTHPPPKISNKDDFVMQKNTRRSNPFIHLGVPMGTAAVAAVIVMVQIGQGASGGLKEHIGGSLVLELVNSSWSQVVLAAITWYLIGVYVAELVDALRSKLGMYKK